MSDPLKKVASRVKQKSLELPRKWLNSLMKSSKQSLPALSLRTVTPQSGRSVNPLCCLWLNQHRSLTGAISKAYCMNAVTTKLSTACSRQMVAMDIEMGGQMQRHNTSWRIERGSIHENVSFSFSCRPSVFLTHSFVRMNEWETTLKPNLIKDQQAKLKAREAYD